MFFESWAGVLRVLIAGVLGYASLLLILRISGKRTLSSLNAFDMVITVALGSTFATVILSKDVALLEGIAAFATLIFGQYIITALSVRSELVRKSVKSSPRLLVYRGELLHGALRDERVTVDEILSVIRRNGAASLEEVAAVVLETNASLNVLVMDDLSADRALENVTGYPPEAPPAPSTGSERSR